MEFASPLLWNLILDLFQHLLLVRAFSQGLVYGVFVQFVELVVETGYHFLNLQVLFLCEHPLHHSCLNLFFVQL